MPSKACTPLTRAPRPDSNQRGKGGRDATTSAVRHRYGEAAGEATGNVFEAAKGVGTCAKATTVIGAAKLSEKGYRNKGEDGEACTA